MAEVLVNNLRIRNGPGVDYDIVGKYDKGDIISSLGRTTTDEEGREWGEFRGGKTGTRLYVCVEDKDGTQFVRRFNYDD